jgi:uncharacterized protein YdiU (UPF0061 family)
VIINSYTKVSNLLFSINKKKICLKPRILLFNYPLAKNIGLNIGNFKKHELVNFLLGYNFGNRSFSISQGYSGYQSGSFNLLGDGRAELFSEIIGRRKHHFDVHLKGLRKTSYSRYSDGKASLSSMIKEYIVSEALHHLNVPATRSLAVIKTGDNVYGKNIEFGTILIRVANSHIRFGTFQYSSIQKSRNCTSSLLTYTVRRYYPKLLNTKNIVVSLLKTLVNQQAKMVTEWARVGFIHGTMSTDNTNITGSTMDYGSCGFMKKYRANKNVNLTDQMSGYSYDRQAIVSKWNMARISEVLIPLIGRKRRTSIQLANNIVNDFGNKYQSLWISSMQNKLGTYKKNKINSELIYWLFKIMQKYSLDYTNTFVSLTYNENILYKKNISIIRQWIKYWKREVSYNTSKISKMRLYNPTVVPRNSLIKESITSLKNYDNIEYLVRVISLCSQPYSVRRY